jgi:hypothetical protein
MASVQRWDRGEVRRAYTTPEGFLFIEGTATRCGVFEYRQPDGSVIRELRDDADVMDRASLASLGRKPATLEHPEINGQRVLVTPDNWDMFAVGQVGERITCAGGFVDVTLTVNRADALAAIRAGVQELSCGYECEIDPTPGVHPTYGRYDQRQTHIQYNHLALVPQGRAGDMARLRMDAAEQITTTTPHHTQERAMAKIKIGDTEYEVDAALAPVLTALRADAADKMPKMDMLAPKSDMSDLAAKMDALKGRADEMMGKYDAAMKKMDSYEAMMGEVMKMLGEMAQDGEISESMLEGMDEKLRGDSIDRSSEAKAERERVRKQRELDAFNARLELVTAARALRVDKADEMDTDALAIKVAESHLGRELRADEKTPAYVRGVCAVAARDAEKTAYSQIGKSMTQERATPRHDAADAADVARQKYEERVRGKAAQS